MAAAIQPQPCLTASGIVTPLASGQVLDYVSPNQYGGMAYLWTTGTPTWLTATAAFHNWTPEHV